MKFFETSKYHFFKKSTYITLRWIGIIGQLIAVNFVYLFINSSFDFITSNLVIFFGILIVSIKLSFEYAQAPKFSLLLKLLNPISTTSTPALETADKYLLIKIGEKSQLL